MTRLGQPVGPIRSRTGGGASNLPRDLHAVGERFVALGLMDETDLTRRPAALTADPQPLQTGFFNRERAVEIHDHHDWGTSWLVDLIESAAAKYRAQHLAASATRFAALITLNDVSPPLGGASPDHAGHQTGLVVDLLLPRTDGTVRRDPLSISAADGLFDRPAMKAMLTAFRDTGKLRDDKALFSDAGGDPAYQACSPPLRCASGSRRWG